MAKTTTEKKKPAAAKPAVKKTATAKPAVAKKPAAAKSIAPKKPRASAPKIPKDLIREAAIESANCLLEKKATDIKLLDVREITSMTDYFIICSCASDIQVKAVAENVIVKMRDEFGLAPWKSEGWDALQWIIVDFVDFVVHIFRDSAREFYNLERLWADAPTETIEDKPAAKKKAVKKKAVV